MSLDDDKAFVLQAWGEPNCADTCPHYEPGCVVGHEKCKAALDRILAALEAAEERARLAGAEHRVVVAAYHLLNSDQCTHAGEDWRTPECRVCNLRIAFDALPERTRDELASSTYEAAVERSEG